MHRYNELGLAGLFDRPRRNGPQPSLSDEQRAKVAEWVEQGPQLARIGVIRWRCVDLQRRIAQEFAVQLHEPTVGKLLRKLTFRRLSAPSRCWYWTAHWHSLPRLKLPENIVLLSLPPYSPELNPMENVWEFMRGKFLSHSVWDGYDAIVRHLL